MEMFLKIKDLHGTFAQTTFELSDTEPLSISIDRTEIRDKAASLDLLVRLNGRTQKITLGSLPQVTISAEWLKAAGAGVMEFALQVWNKSRSVEINKGAYKIDPLTLTRTDRSGWQGTDVIRDLQDRLKAAEEKIAAIESWKEQAVKAIDKIVAYMEEKENQGV